MKNYDFDKILLQPGDIDLTHSPLRRQISEETYVLGAFNPGLSRLPNSNLILMVRVAEALRHPVREGSIRSIRWDRERGYVLDTYALSEVDASDPRKFVLQSYEPTPVFALTSLSWLLPVELDAAGERVVHIHYDKIIAPEAPYQEYGIEDARISRIEGKYFLTTCSVSSERHATTLYRSDDGLNYSLEGIILDHQNKDMLLFEGRIGGRYYALTRPLGSAYFATPPGSRYQPGPSINLAESPDLLHWKPLDEPFLRLRENGRALLKLGGGAQPILTPRGWLILFHLVEKKGEVGIYTTHWALLDKEDPSRIRHLEMDRPLLTANSELTTGMEDEVYLRDVVFTTGIVDGGDHYIVASGELDLCCRITHIPKADLEWEEKEGLEHWDAGILE